MLATKQGPHLQGGGGKKDVETEHQKGKISASAAGWCGG